jgi:hypothetical protein
VLRHGAEIAVGVDFVPDRRGPAVMSELLQRFRRSVVDEGDLGVLGCHRSSMFPAEASLECTMTNSDAQLGPALARSARRALGAHRAPLQRLQQGPDLRHETKPHTAG